VEIGQHAMVGAGAVVTKAVPPYAIVTGNPARVRGFVTRTSTSAQSPPGGPRGPTRVEGVSWIALGQGGGSDVDVPFAPKSIRVLRGPSGRTRQHEGARQRSHQIFLCAAGTCSVLVDDGCARETLHLNEREAALYVPPLVWVSWFNRSQDSSVVILSSDEGGPDDLISDYEAFVRSHGNPDGNGQDQ
jgi:UDP-2-acetamido-3-amino-2,3-dideoxy-glucuronate N-acetyltransferase